MQRNKKIAEKKKEEEAIRLKKSQREAELEAIRLRRAGVDKAKARKAGKYLL